MKNILCSPSQASLNLWRRIHVVFVFVSRCCCKPCLYLLLLFDVWCSVSVLLVSGVYVCDMPPSCMSLCLPVFVFQLCTFPLNCKQKNFAYPYKQNLFIGSLYYLYWAGKTCKLQDWQVPPKVGNSYFLAKWISAVAGIVNGLSSM